MENALLDKDPQAKYRGLPPKTKLVRKEHRYQGKRYGSIIVSVTRSSPDGYWAATREDRIYHVSFTALESGWWKIEK
jgi:hypothetical protein